MNKLWRRALFIFRRDLRLEDNTGLLFALRQAQEVIPCFIFTPEQIENNPHFSGRALQFMIESLEDLEEELKSKKGKLYFFYGSPEKIVEQCIAQEKVDAVVVNRDYTPYSISRDQKIANICQQYHVTFHSLEDTLLHPVEETVKRDGQPYTVFTPFYRTASRLRVPPPSANRLHNYSTRPIFFAESSQLFEKILPHRSSQAPGGRKAALKILRHLDRFTAYSAERHFPALEGTTRLSAHLKFTTCSIREAYHAIAHTLGPDSDLMHSLYWRDFFTSIAFYFPQVFGKSFHSKFDQLPWTNDQKAFDHWCEGKTGFPIVDAGMRELQKTGYMHNRARMITASFLVKDLHIDWRWGEKYFAQTLIDYDPAVNNGNWQWVASTGCDAQPYFRILNPWTQQKKFDPDCHYIRRWIPELADVPAKIIHEWYRPEHHSLCPSYPDPLIDHAKEAKKALSLYRAAR